MQYVINGLFIARGRDPAESHWDEIATTALTAPVLVFLFNNSVLSVVTDLIAGLGPGLGRRLFQRRARVRPEAPVVIPVEGDPLGALVRNSVFAFALAGIGSVLCCCGSCLLPTQTWQREPQKLTIAELEAGWKPPTGKGWVEIADGYLFFPRMTTGEVSRQWTGGDSPERSIVPLVGPELRDEWVRVYQRHGKQGPYSYARCRLVVGFPREVLAERFPDAAAGRIDPERPFAQASVHGIVLEYDDTQESTRRAVADGAVDLPSDKLLVLQFGQKKADQTFILILLALGLVSAFPLVIRRMVGWPRRGDRT